MGVVLADGWNAVGGCVWCRKKQRLWSMCWGSRESRDASRRDRCAAGRRGLGINAQRSLRFSVFQHAALAIDMKRKMERLPDLCLFLPKNATLAAVMVSSGHFANTKTCALPLNDLCPGGKNSKAPADNSWWRIDIRATICPGCEQRGVELRLPIPHVRAARH